MDGQTRGMIYYSLSRGYNSMNSRGNVYSTGYNPGGNAYSRGYNTGFLRSYDGHEDPNAGYWHARSGTDSSRYCRGPGERHTNPLDVDGQLLRCDSCQLIWQFFKYCSDSWNITEVYWEGNQEESKEAYGGESREADV